MFKIFIIEDELIIRRGLVYSVDWASLDCIVIGEADNGYDALKQVSKLNPDIVLLDINMPIMDGIDFLAHTQEHKFKTIVISGHNEFEYAKQAIRYGISDYLLKPVDHKELEAAITKSKQELTKEMVYEATLQMDDSELVIFPVKYNQDSFINKLNEYLEKNYMDKIMLLNVADHLLISVSHISNKIKKTYNMTFNSYLNRFRIQKAIEMIKDTDCPIYEISQLCGFSEYKYFSQVFKKYVGMSPRELKNHLNIT
jgi:two-component system response regulator YesN